MAKQKFEPTRKMPVTRLLPWAAIVLGLGISPSWAGQQYPKGPSPSAKTATSTGQKETGATPAKSAPKPAQWREQTTVQKPARATPARSARTPAQRKEMAASSRSALLPSGARDPFKLPEVSTGGVSRVSGAVNSAAGSSGILPPGPRGLVISQLRLEGVVREQAANKMIAVVTNETKRAYFLSENEAVYNGAVSKITPDAVYFTENVLDAEGRVTTREVVKRLNPASGEGR